MDIGAHEVPKLVRNHLLLAVACAAALLPMAFLYPVEGIQGVDVKSGASYVTPMFSLVRVNGVGVLRFVVLPLLLALCVSWVLVRRVRTGSDIAGWTSWLLTVLMGLGAFVGAVTFLIGIYVLPSAVFLVLANLEVAKSAHAAP